MTANINGLAAIIARIPEMDGVAERLKHDFATALDYWPYLFFGISVWSIILVSLIGWWALSRVMARLLVSPMCTSWNRRPTPDRSGRCPPG